jgi:YesN/AraC family two-component response regulator
MIMDSRRKLIYVDDEKYNLILFEMSFRGKFEIFTAISGSEALELIKKENIKLIIADYKMPFMTGMELIKHVKAYQPDAVCMILSAYLENEVVTEKSMIHKYILKPYNQEQLLKDIEDAFSIVLD